jgi:hypothetical protein
LLKLAEVKMRPGQFIKPQLAHLYEPDKVVYPVRAEYKIDGSRLQVHKWGTQIWLFSRRGVEKVADSSGNCGDSQKVLGLKAALWMGKFSL